MKKISSWLFVCAAVLFGLVCLMPVQAEAAQQIEWHTTNLYYELTEDNTPENILVIEGYFVNNTDKYINYFHEFNLTATITDDGGYTGTIKGTFRNFEKMIDPFSRSDHRFRIRNAEIIWPVDSYNVKRGYIKWKYSGAAG
ncbi:MAG: hypothetical protein AAGU23_00320 [Bacillota bacterium]|nr:hypothetical protein [Bacillota bacterium]